jgi:5-hydroxyisourate hydrolase-like protein (transthyretin family)
VHARLSRVERKELVTTHTYTVDVATQEPCATIRFALYTTERISKKKVKVVKTADEVRVRDGSISRILNYDMPNGREMVRWEVKLTGCERCEP